eukprot:14194716-Alexandrium_andersonii.AAC.1
MVTEKEKRREGSHKRERSLCPLIQMRKMNFFGCSVRTLTSSTRMTKQLVSGYARLVTGASGPR